MNPVDILTKAIAKSILGGWDILERSERNGFTVQEDIYGNYYIAWSDDPEDDEAMAQSYQEVIFNHDFAKALWGDPWANFTDGRSGDTISGAFINWKGHLINMVVSENPIEYLGSNS